MTHTKTMLASIITLVLAGPALAGITLDPDAQHSGDHAEKPAESTRVGDPYSLDTCPVSGLELGTMGESIIKVYDGREIRFCCEGCPEKFEADKETYISKIDALMIADQAPFYPMVECVVSGESLSVDGEDVATEVIYNNRLVRFCCKMCKSDFKADPESYLAKLDLAVIAAQRDRYPLTECVISSEDITEIPADDVIEIVVANRLFRLCCPPCAPDVLANPAQAIKRLDAAWAQSEGGMPGATMASIPEMQHDNAAHQSDHLDTSAPDAHNHSGENHH